MLMTNNNVSQSINQPRRSDRAVTDEAWIKDFLSGAPFGALATVGEGQPFINMNQFVYDEADHVIYLHTAAEGRTRTNIEGEERVCFSVGEMGRMLPADTAMGFSVEYAGVVVFGRANIIKDPDRARHALQLLLDKYAPHLRPGQDYRPITDEEIQRTGVFCIQIDSWSGKKKEAPADFPNAYQYADHPMLPSNYWRRNYEV
jgi:nitroimidazol reductase NimA-like FMN-containing flavoprotein (pyridoxamine 5'-phosphate oxidase superfamily)